MPERNDWNIKTLLFFFCGGRFRFKHYATVRSVDYIYVCIVSCMRLLIIIVFSKLFVEFSVGIPSESRADKWFFSFVCCHESSIECRFRPVSSWYYNIYVARVSSDDRPSLKGVIWNVPRKLTMERFWKWPNVSSALKKYSRRINVVIFIVCKWFSCNKNSDYNDKFIYSFYRSRINILGILNCLISRFI